MSEEKGKIKGSSFLLALVCILVADARRKGCLDDLYLGSIKLPDCRILMMADSPHEITGYT